jgi:hypothetical protein
MIQCSDCEHYHTESDGSVGFSCNPFTNVKEPECLVKWQLIKIDTMVRAYQTTVQMYQRLAPLQEKMLRQMENEMQDVDEADAWKYRYIDEDDDEDEGEPDEPN